MIRQAQLSDIPSIADIDAQLFPGNAFTREMLKLELSGYKEFSWVKEQAGMVVGYAVSRPQGDLVDLLRLGVDVPFQRHGIGSELLKQVVDSSPTVMVTVQKDNQAVRFYHRHGLRIVGDLGEAWVMKLTLDAG